MNPSNEFICMYVCMYRVLDFERKVVKVKGMMLKFPLLNLKFNFAN